MIKRKIKARIKQKIAYIKYKKRTIPLARLCSNEPLQINFKIAQQFIRQDFTYLPLSGNQQRYIYEVIFAMISMIQWPLSYLKLGIRCYAILVTIVKLIHAHKHLIFIYFTLSMKFRDTVFTRFCFCHNKCRRFARWNLSQSE